MATHISLQLSIPANKAIYGAQHAKETPLQNSTQTSLMKRITGLDKYTRQTIKLKAASGLKGIYIYIYIYI